MRNIGAALGLSLVMLGGGSGWAKDIYVRAGSNGDGSKANPYNDIDDGLRDAFTGDVIHVAGGDYYGAGQSGKLIINKPGLTLVGGYNADFSERQPFKHITRLVRGEDPDPKACRKSPRCTEIVTRQKVPQTKASYNPVAMIVGEGTHQNTIIDGLVVDGYTRNMYKPNDDLSLAVGPIGTPCISFHNPGIKLRNVVVVNCAGPGISLNALGTKLEDNDPRDAGDDWPEITNSVILNTVQQSIDFRVGNQDDKNAPNGGAALIRNNTIAFNWELNGENYNIIQGRQTRLTVRDNILAFAGFGIHNGFGNRFGRYQGNVFFSHTDGEYRYFDETSKTTLVEDDVAKLAGDTCKKKLACSKQSKDNAVADPKFTKLDTFVFDKWLNQIASTGGGKVNMDSMNQWRSSLGLPLQGSAGTGRVNFAPIWDPGVNGAGLQVFSDDLKGKGAQFNGLNGKFETYAGKTAPQPEKSYLEVAWDDIKRNGKAAKEVTAKGASGSDVQVRLKIGDEDTSAFYMPDTTGVAKDKGWVCYRDATRNLFIYAQQGSPAINLIKQAKKEGAEIVLKGTAFDVTAKIKSPGYVGIAVDAAESTDSD